MSNPLCVIFDLDGTLVDSAPDLAATANVLLQRRGRAPVSLDQVRSMVGKGAKVLMERTMAATGEPMSEDELKTILPEFIEYYGTTLADNTLPFPGVREALDHLGGRGDVMGVCTNKFEQLSVSLLDQLSLSHHFGAVVGGDSLAVRKPDGGHILGTISQLGADPAHTVMVGDSNNDIDAAKHAGVASIAVTFGYTDIPAEKLGADRLISHFDQLIPAIDDLMG